MNIEHIYSLFNRLNVTNCITNILNPLIAIKWKKNVKTSSISFDSQPFSSTRYCTKIEKAQYRLTGFDGSSLSAVNTWSPSKEKTLVEKIKSKRTSPTEREKRTKCLDESSMAVLGCQIVGNSILFKINYNKD